MAITDIMLGKLAALHASEARSQQAEVGASELGGCRRQLWYRVHHEPAVNAGGSYLSRTIGTAVHAALESAFQGDPGYLAEAHLVSDGVAGHIDLIRLLPDGTAEVWDWKTTRKQFADKLGSPEQQAQVQVYGWLARRNGFNVTHVGLVGICLDGSESDVIEVQWDYDEELAESMVQRLRDVGSMRHPPDPERATAHCANFCRYFGTCPGKT